MKRVLLLFAFLLFNLPSYSQISLTGDANYKFTVIGYQGRDGDACGDIYGLRQVRVDYNDGSSGYFLNGRLASEPFDFTTNTSKDRFITNVHFYSINRWETFFGCEGGPNHHYVDRPVNNVDFNQYIQSQTHEGYEITINSKPFVKLNINPAINYTASSKENLVISLPDNLKPEHLNWKYSIAGGTPQDFPAAYNQKSVLNIPIESFLTLPDFGKPISVWVEMNSTMGEKFAEGYALRSLLLARRNFFICVFRECGLFNDACQQNCINFYRPQFDFNYHFTEELKAEHQSKTSNIFSFVAYFPSPKITSSSFTAAKCSDTTDGSLNLNFERTLIAGETLEMVLVNTDTGAAVLNQDLTTILQTQTTHAIQNLPPGNYKLDLVGTYQGNPTYTDSSDHTLSFAIAKPAPVTYSLTAKTDVFCFEGNDGNIILTAGGGQGQYQYLVTKDGLPFVGWTNFSNGTMTNINNLSAGVYKIKVRDTNQCMAKDNGVEKEITVTISQPTEAITLSEIENIQPTGFGLSNGYISVRVTGGTPNANGSYNYEWRKDSPTGAVISTGITTDLINNPFTILLNNLTAGKYYLTVTDKNYAGSTSNRGNCGILSQEFIVTQPDPLIATIQVDKTLSCNGSNEDAFKLDLNSNGILDNAEDGILQTKVTGGVGTYKYQWQVLNNGVFVDLPNEKNAILNNFTAGQYKIKVSDANNNQTEQSYTAVFPSKMEITLSANTIKCNNQLDGEVSVTATGGTGVYTYEWNTGATTPTVTGLSSGNFVVMVKDQKKCSIKGKVEILQPDKLAIEEIAIENPVCFGANNGKIQIKVTGGKMPYNISWSNGQKGESLTGLVAGKYLVTLIDANGCILTREYTLTNPEKLTVDLGKDLTLCLGDTKSYNVKIADVGATYQWTKDGVAFSSSAEVKLSEAGTYEIVITDSKDCVATDDVVISLSNAVLDPKFLITTYAYNDKSVVLVNSSTKMPEKVEWVIPNTSSIQVIDKNDDYLTLKFFETGSYELGLKGMEGACEKTVFKKIVVDENLIGNNDEPTASNIKSFEVVPNPNDGNYKVMVELFNEAAIKLRIIDMSAKEIIVPVSKSNATLFEVPFNHSLSAGSYLVVMETGGEAIVKRMLVR